jgi:urease accessory protein
MSLAAPDDDRNREELENEIADLEARLHAVKQRLGASNSTSLPIITTGRPHYTDGPHIPPCSSPSSQHFLLLLSDSALPLGSFAFSSGLESFNAHTRGGSSASLSHLSPLQSFQAFMPLSLSSYASTTLPFVLAAHRHPAAVARLDDAYDAAVMCTVGHRASVVQGRALLGVWEKSLGPAYQQQQPQQQQKTREQVALLGRLRALPSAEAMLASAWDRGHAGDDEEGPPPPYSAHLAPLFGAVCHVLGLTLQQTAYVFLLSHVKALVSAGVRAAMMGPYVAQRILASGEVQALIAAAVKREWETSIEEAGQTVPVMDLWVGRHEMLYSRIFNS